MNLKVSNFKNVEVRLVNSLQKVRCRQSSFSSILSEVWGLNVYSLPNRSVGELGCESKAKCWLTRPRYL